MGTLMVLLLAGHPCTAGVVQPGHGEGLAVSLDNLLFMPEEYDCKLVRTIGTLDVGPARPAPIYTLRGTFGGRLVLLATPQAADAWAAQAPRWIGREVEVTGLVSLTRPGTAEDAPPALTDPDTGGTAIYLSIRGFLGPPDAKPARDAVSRPSLAAITANPKAFAGKTVTVLGQFRGSNRFGDLPPVTRHRGSDWVIKDGRSAVWVTGRLPNGKGWSLDPMLESDTRRWLRVTGRISASKGVVFIRAASVSLARAPTADSLRPDESPN